MFNIIGEVFDHYDDSLEKVDSVLVDKKNIPMSRPDNAQHAFVIIDNQNKEHAKYPLDSKENTALSIQYFVKTYDKLPVSCMKKVAKRIKLAADKFGLETPALIQQYADMESNYNGEFPVIYFLSDEEPAVYETNMTKTAAKLTSQQRENLPDSVFGLVITKKNGEKIRKFPMPDESHTRFAISMFARSHKDLPAEQKSILAKNIKQQAKKYGITISPDNPLNKYASFSQYPNNLDEIINERIKLAKDNTAKKGYELLYKASAELSPEEFGRRMYTLDKLAAVDDYYALIGTPEEIMNPSDKQEKIETKVPSYAELDANKELLSDVLDEETLDALIENPKAVWEELPVELRITIWQIIRGINK
jgi:hypothetical protein